MSSVANIYFQNATVLNHTGQIAGALRIERDRIAALDAPPRKNDFVVDLEGRIIVPGLVNAHDHLAMNNFGKIKYRDVYANAHEWSLDIEARLDTDPVITLPRRVPIADRLFHGALKNLLAGVTTVCHHDPWHRSLDARDFPVRVVQRSGYCHSLQRGGDIARSYRRTPRDAPWIIHLAEGTDDGSARELDSLDELGCLRENTVLVHAVALTASQQQKALERGAAMIWCPSSNYFLLNRTAQVGDFASAHRLALGSDSRLTGARDLLAEMKYAHEMQQIAPDDLVRIVTEDAARILRLNAGRIAVGARADLLILPAHQMLGHVQRADLCAVLLGGAPRIADPNFAPLMRHAVRRRLDGCEKLFARDLAERYAHSSIQEEGLDLNA